MRLRAQLQTWWNAIARRGRVRAQVEEELQFHIDAYVDDLIRRGIPEEKARRQARIEIGRPDTQGERYRKAIALGLLDEIGGDLRYGFRALLRNPGLSCIAILSLAIGIGATVAMFSLIYAVLLHPFPYSSSSRIVNPVLINERQPDVVTWFTVPGAQWKTFRRAACISSVLGFSSTQMEVTGSGIPEGVDATYLTGNANSFFGVHPLLGRNIQPFDTHSRQPVVVLNYRFWQQRFNGNTSVIGHALQLDHRDYTIVGVMPRSFTFDDTIGTADVYLPRTSGKDEKLALLPWIRLKKGVSRVSANQELNSLVHQFAQQYPQRYPKQFRVELQPILAPFEHSTGHTLFLLFAGVVFLLLIGCANCSILFLARGAARTHELSVRVALGASRWRIVRQLLVESVYLSFAGAALGVAASYWLAQLPLQLSPSSFPPESSIHINLPVLGFSVGLAITSGIFFGLAPALRLSRPETGTSIQSASSRASKGHRSLHVLVSVQVAITLLLMATASIAMGAFLEIMQSPLGYNPRHVLQIGIMMHWRNPNEWKGIQSRDDRAAYIDQIRSAIARVPGVMSVAIGTNATPPDHGAPQKVETSRNGRQEPALVMTVGQHYFQTLDIPILRGRIWSSTENARGDGVAVVNESFVRYYLDGRNVLGQEISIPKMKSNAPLLAASPDSSGWREIVAVVADARNNGLEAPAKPAVYVPYSTFIPPFAQYEIRTRTAPLLLLPVVRKAVASVASDQQVSRGAYDLEQAVRQDPQWQRQRLFSVLFGVFSAMALLLAIAGLMSVVWFSVSRRTTEFGIRLALGATRTNILWVAARATLLSAGFGILFGSLAAAFLRTFLGSWMKSGHASLVGLINVAVLLAIVMLAACLLPARRAATVDPMNALRNE